MIDHKVVDEFVCGCLHEAAHAIAADVLGFRVSSVWARGGAPEGEESGRVDIADIDSSRAAAVVYAAGEAADWRRLRNLTAWNREASYRGGDQTRPGYFPTMSPGDVRGIRQYLAANYFSGAAANSETEAVKADAARVVGEHWRKITAVADALIDASGGRNEARLSREQFLATLKKQ